MNGASIGTRTAAYGTYIATAGTAGELRDFAIIEDIAERPPRGTKFGDRPGIGTGAIALIIISALLFLLILAWYQALAVFYDETFLVVPGEQRPRYQATRLRVGWAFFVTGLVLFLLMLYWLAQR